MPPLNFGPEIQYFDEFEKEFFWLYCHSEWKSGFLQKIKWLVVISWLSLHKAFVQDEICTSRHHFQYWNAGFYNKSKSKCVPCKAPTSDIWHSGSAVISIIVVVAMRGTMHMYGLQFDLLCQLGTESLNWVGTVKIVGQIVPLMDSPHEEGRSIAVLVCHNVPEVVLTCQLSGCTSTVGYFRWIHIY